MKTTTDYSLIKSDNTSYYVVEDFKTLYPAVFSSFINNYHIQEHLMLAGVIVAGTKMDSQDRLFRVHFSGEKSAKNFVDRLNSYMQRMTDLLGSLA